MEAPCKISFSSMEELQDIYSNLASTDIGVLENITATCKDLILAQNPQTKSFVRTSHNLLCRIYFRALDILGKPDAIIVENFQTFHYTLRVSTVNALLFTDQHKYLEFVQLVKLIQQILDSVINASALDALICFRTVNLLYKKYPGSQIHFTLAHFYTCLQTQSSAVRDECVIFFKNWLESEQNAEEVFGIIANYWPWSNKFKYVLLSVILSTRLLESLIAERREIEIFMQGLRLSLRYKGLFAVGQLVVRCLSKNSSRMFNNFLVLIMKEGSACELIYLNSQWMHYVQEKNDLCVHLGFFENVDSILGLEFIENDPFRFVLICTIFEKQLQKSPHIESIVDYMCVECFNFDLEAQLYAFKFIVNSMIATGSHLAESLKYVIDFMKMHLFVPSSEFRNTILGKLPIIVDYLSKISRKVNPAVTEFFARLKDVFRSGISHKEYQPLIFNLKLFETLLKCCQSSSHKSLMKNSHVKLHQSLAKLLVDENVWNFQDEQQTILDLLLSCEDFDDVREMIVKILILLEAENSEKGFRTWKKLVQDPDIDKCVLSLYYARLSVHWHTSDLEFSQSYFQWCIDKIKLNSTDIDADALSACKKGNHIFGFFNSLNEFFEISKCSLNRGKELLVVAIEEAEKAVQLVLSKLNVAGSEETNASFQTMEESLEMLVSESSLHSEVHAVDRKYLLLSFWLTLKACCELATSIGIKLVEQSESNTEFRELLKRCIAVHSTILHGCRHKGAIEAAGTSLGQLVKGISSAHAAETETYKILYGCFDVLFGSVNNISTTRRGAGLSIMFHHFIKNDSRKSRPLFQHAIKILMEHVQKSRSPSHNPKELDECHDNFEALVLHYLCVLVRDSELKECISEYYDEIMMSAIVRITDKEWTIRNGALQLFGALVPKIVGQKQAAVGECEKLSWEPSEITFTEFCIKLPKTNVHIMNYCKNLNQGRKSTSSIILFLEFLSSIDYIKKGDDDNYKQQLIEFREILWRFLSHRHEKIRKLSSKCLVRFHDFHEELPGLVLRTIDLMFSSQNDNFIHGLILFYIHALHKLKVEAQFISQYDYDDFCKDLRNVLTVSYQKKRFSCYIRRYLVELFTLAKCSFKSNFVKDMLANGDITESDSRKSYLNFGIDTLHEKLAKIEN